MCVAQVAVRSPLSCLVPKLLGNSEALQQTQVAEDRLDTTRFLLHSNVSGRLILVCKAPTHQGSGAHAAGAGCSRKSSSFAIQHQKGPFEKW